MSCTTAHLSSTRLQERRVSFEAQRHPAELPADEPSILERVAAGDQGAVAECLDNACSDNACLDSTRVG